jgi:hypothetical protein
MKQDTVSKSFLWTDRGIGEDTINLCIQVDLVFTDIVNSVTDDCINTRVSVNVDKQKLNVSIDL